MNEITPEWDAKRDALTVKMQALQAAIIAESGGLDLREYRRRLVETGLQAEWDALQAEPGAHKTICTYERGRK